MCTVLLPPGDNPIAVNKYIISYHINYPEESIQHAEHGESLKSEKSQFTTDAQNVLNLNQCTHKRVWSWTITTFQRSRCGCKWFDVHQKCFCELFVCFKLELVVLGVWGSTRCWAVPQKLSFFFFCRRVNFFPCFDMWNLVLKFVQALLILSIYRKPPTDRSC